MSRIGRVTIYNINILQYLIFHSDARSDAKKHQYGRHLLQLIAFMTTFLTGDFTLTRIAILAFGLDFALRVLISPRYAPSAAYAGKW